MSIEHIEKYYQQVQQNPALFKELLEGVDTPEAFIARAVAAAQKEGLDVSVDEATAWINSQMKDNKDGELSDVQLEAVAGGKGASEVGGDVGGLVGGIAGGRIGFGKEGRDYGSQAGSAIVNYGSQAGTAISNWFSSW